MNMLLKGPRMEEHMNVIEAVTDVDFEKKQLVKTKFRLLVTTEPIPGERVLGWNFFVKVERLESQTVRTGGC
jgi:hypothetical protein